MRAFCDQVPVSRKRGSHRAQEIGAVGVSLGLLASWLENSRVGVTDAGRLGTDAGQLSVPKWNIRRRSLANDQLPWTGIQVLNPDGGCGNGRVADHHTGLGRWRLFRNCYFWHTFSSCRTHLWDYRNTHIEGVICSNIKTFPGTVHASQMSFYWQDWISWKGPVYNGDNPTARIFVASRIRFAIGERSVYSRGLA